MKGSSSSSWCLLRKIKFHSDLVSHAFCHHWSQQESFLGEMDGNAFMSEQQLDFARDLVINEI